MNKSTFKVLLFKTIKGSSVLDYDSVRKIANKYSAAISRDIESEEKNKLRKDKNDKPKVNSK